MSEKTDPAQHNDQNTDYRSVTVTRGGGGWGKGLRLSPTPEKNIVLSVTGGGIHPVAARIAELTGAEAVDGFTTTVPDETVLAAVINCGGTARIGVYPRKKIATVDVFPGEPSGPLAQFITEDLFVSAVGVQQVQPAEGEQAATTVPPADAGQPTAASTTFARPPAKERLAQTAEAMGGGSKIGGAFSRFVVSFGSAIGYFINTLLSAGRQAVTLTIQTILPFMVYVSLLIGIVTYTGVSEWIAQGVQPLASNPLGLILLGFITAIPLLSPILGPGAAIAQVVGVLMGTQIAQGALPVQYALPTLFAINGQVGCDFVPVGLSLGEAKPETVAVGTPAVLFSRMITSPLAVLIAWGASFLLV
ncbi:PTS glucitol/sorbitol transporter subunit IIB [Kocuria arenosa]|jgi:PTS system glucitol/sorbitol-specific IIB component|uniref:PTS glucitol/sorbitol transporter subunit IIB n=1 Tax=Kocuria arenosa TaxID=3071446 RepID=UPI0034D6A520